MEAVATASSLAGLISVAGQIIDGILKLRNLYLEVASASKTIAFFLHDINSLLRVLYDVEKLLCMISASDQPSGSGLNASSLRVQLEQCNQDTFKWMKKARDLRPASGNTGWQKKIWVGINQGPIKSIREEIGRHKQTIEINLSILGRKLDLQLYNKINRLNDKVDELSLISMSSQDLSTNHQEVLERIENYSRANLLSSANSIMSLESIDSTLSRLECLATTASNPSTRTDFPARLPPPVDSQDNSRDLLTPPRHKVSKLISRTPIKLPKVPLRKTALPEQEYVFGDHDLLQQMTEDIYPKVIADYISSSRSVAFFENHLALVKARLRHEYGSTEIVDASGLPNFYKLFTQRQQLEDHLTQLRQTVQTYKKQCIQSGHSLHEVDAALYQSSELQRTHKVPTTECHNDMFEIRRRTLDSRLLKDWRSTRDRINSWLLHSLRSDDSHARLHRSLLAEQELDGSEWATLVLEHWTVDEAATGLDLATSLSVGATHSHTNSSNVESVVDYMTCYESVSERSREE